MLTERGRRITLVPVFKSVLLGHERPLSYYRKTFAIEVGVKMPVYEYECNACRKVFEVQQKMADKPLTSCPECDGEVKKLMSMSSFQLKGGGWYADGYASSSEKSPSKAESTPACATGGGCSGCPAASAS